MISTRDNGDISHPTLVINPMDSPWGCLVAFTLRHSPASLAISLSLLICRALESVPTAIPSTQGAEEKPGGRFVDGAMTPE